MKRISTAIFVSLIVLLTFIAAYASAQETTAGTVTYQQITRYDFRSIFGSFNDAHADAWLDQLPTQSKSLHQLLFTEDKSLFRKDPDSAEITSKLLLGALDKADYFRPPGVELLQVYTERDNNEQIRQVEFMTRHFIIGDTISKPEWRLTNDRVRIKQQICMSAEMEEGDDLITA